MLLLLVPWGGFCVWCTDSGPRPGAVIHWGRAALRHVPRISHSRQHFSTLELPRFPSDTCINDHSRFHVREAQLLQYNKNKDVGLRIWRSAKIVLKHMNLKKHHKERSQTNRRAANLARTYWNMKEIRTNLARTGRRTTMVIPASESSYSNRVNRPNLIVGGHAGVAKQGRTSEGKQAGRIGCTPLLHRRWTVAPGERETWLLLEYKVIRLPARSLRFATCWITGILDSGALPAFRVPQWNSRDPVHVDYKRFEWDTF